MSVKNVGKGVLRLHCQRQELTSFEFGSEKLKDNKTGLQTVSRPVE